MDELKTILSYLPRRLHGEILRLADQQSVEEIRLRRSMPLSVTAGGRNLRGCGMMTPKEAQETLLAVCGGSLYTHMPTLTRGYVSLPNGIRVGIVGVATERDGSIDAVRDITSISFRIPRSVRGQCGPILHCMEANEFAYGVLIFSLPGVGKTTLLRDIAISLSSAPYLKRVALIDSRNELFRPAEFASCLCDPLLGYPKDVGITLAVRNLSPQVVICDEIGTDLEASAILSVHPSGVPLIATVHGNDLNEIRQRSGISALIERGVFRHFFRLKREGKQISVQQVKP